MMRATIHYLECLSLRTKLILSFVFVILIATLISSFITYYQWKRDFYAQVREEGSVLVQTLAQGSVDPILRHDFSTLEEYVNTLLKKENVVYVIFTDRHDHVLAGGDQEVAIPPEVIKQGLSSRQPVLVQNFRSGERRMLINDISVPVLIDGKKWGAVRVGFSLVNVEREIYSNIVFALLSACLSLAGGIAVALVLTRIITKPVTRFIGSMRRISQGDLSEKIEIASPDEFGQMADSFNRMAHSLQESQETLRTTFAELAEKQKLAALGELSARVAHEIKNPLGIIRGSAQIIVDGKTPLAIKEEVGRYIIEETDKLNHIVMDILNYAQPQRRASVPIDINRLITDNRVLWEKALAEKGTIVLSIALHADLPQIQGDPNLLQRALLNLVMNAGEAAQPEGTVHIETFSAEGADVGVSIADSGPGMDDAAMEKAFEPFFTTKKQGTGLGLSIVRNIVESHNGSITLERREEGGTKVTMLFPAART